MGHSRADVPDRLRGVMVPLVTPFDPALEIDWLAYDQHIERLLAAGIRVLLAADLVGEAWALTFEEKVALFERTVRIARGRATIIAKISEPAPLTATRLAAAAGKAGVDAIKVVLPAPVLAGDEEAYGYLLAVTSQSGVPFLVEANGSDVSLALLDRLVEHDLFVGIEETSLDLDRFQILIERYSPKVPVIAGSEDALGFTLLLGAAGFMTASPNFAPEFMTALWRAGASGDASRTLGLYGRLRRFRRLFRSELEAGRPAFVSYTKAALQLLGHPVGLPRLPVRPLVASEMVALAEVLREALDLNPIEGGLS